MDTSKKPNESVSVSGAKYVSAPELGVASCWASGFWRSARGENHGRDSQPGDVWCEPGDITDTDRLNWLCAKAAEGVISFGHTVRNDEQWVVDRTMNYFGPTLREAIDEGILSSPNTKGSRAEERE